MSLVADLVQILGAASAVTSQLATNTKNGTKAIRPIKLAQGDIMTASAGAIELVTENGDPQNGLDGSAKTGIFLIKATCVSLTASCSNAIANAVHDLLEPFSGATASGTIDSVDVVDRREDWGCLEDGTDTGEYIVELDLSVFYRRS